MQCQRRSTGLRSDHLTRGLGAEVVLIGGNIFDSGDGSAGFVHRIVTEGSVRLGATEEIGAIAEGHHSVGRQSCLAARGGRARVA
jgi:hypothetical protein